MIFNGKNKEQLALMIFEYRLETIKSFPDQLVA